VFGVQPSAQTIQFKTDLIQFERPFCRAKREQSKRGIESLIGGQPISTIKESLLPKGEGQDEGETRLITERPVIFCRREKPALNCIDWASGGHLFPSTHDPRPFVFTPSRKKKK
jgi:hypothetical protein